MKLAGCLRVGTGENKEGDVGARGRIPTNVTWTRRGSSTGAWAISHVSGVTYGHRFSLQTSKSSSKCPEGEEEGEEEEEDRRRDGRVVMVVCGQVVF